LLRSIATLLVLADANVPAMKQMDMESPMLKGEQDALMQAVSQREDLKDSVVSGREISKDGKSGRITFSNPNKENERWSPQHVVSARGLRNLFETEDIVMALFFSSAEDELGQSHTMAKPFEEAAQRMLEAEDQVSMVLLDTTKTDCAEFGVTRPHVVKIFVAGRGSDYRGQLTADGIVEYLTARSGSPTTKVDNAEELDALLAGDANSSATLVVGVFGPAYNGNSMREAFNDAALKLRDPNRIRFVDTSTYVANAAKRLWTVAPSANQVGEPTAFQPETAAYSIVLPPRWVGKDEVPYNTFTDFRSLYRNVRSRSFPRVAPLCEQYVQHVKIHQKKKLMVVLLLDQTTMTKRFRYVLKQFHKMLDAEPSLTESFGFAFSTIYSNLNGDARLDPWLANRFDRTTIDRTFYQLDKFESDILAPFLTIVADVTKTNEPPSDRHPDGTSSTNWLTTELVGSSPDNLDPSRIISWLKSVASGAAPPLAQGSDAAPAAGLKEMKMGFGGDSSMETGDVKKKKKKSKKKKKATKDEI